MQELTVFPVQEDRTGTALSGAAAFLGSRQAEILPQETEQSPVLGDVSLV
jgi:hypothetical protein